jgi:sugar porter (SP) family MFS transporter
LTHPRTMLLFLVLLIGFFCQTMNGFDTMLFGGLLANKEYFLAHFHGENKGIWAGLITSMYQIGGVCALPFIGPAIDTWGRRVGMVIGSVAIVAGTVVQGTTVSNASEGQMMGGRFLCGWGVGIAAAAGPIWIVETAHPRYRGVVTGLCNTTWLVGAILASGATRGGLDIKGNASWLIPIWLQLVFPALIVIFAFFLPESPRWLYSRGKTEQAIKELTYWHGFGNRESVWVRLQLTEYEQHLELDGSDKRWWDYRPIFTKRSNLYRVLTACWFSAFTQWCGNSVLSYFMPAVLDTAGVNTSIGKANVNLGYSCFQFFWAVIGAHFVEKIGRRKMMLMGFFGTAIVWVCMTAAAGTLAQSLESGTVAAGDAVFSNDSASNAVLAFIFIFGGVYSFNITPLQSLYPVECINFNIRAKGMALQSFAVSAAGLMNQFAWPIAIQEIQWKTYIIFIVWCAIQGVIAYFVFPETRKRTVCTSLSACSGRMLIRHSLRNSTRSSRLRTLLSSPSPATSLHSRRTIPLLLSTTTSRYDHRQTVE